MDGILLVMWAAVLDVRCYELRGCVNGASPVEFVVICYVR